jgi:predicted nucleotidyltransferase
MKINREEIAKIILSHHPQTQAIYLFGSFATGQENEKSDVDLAVLLPHDESKKIPSFALSDVLFELSSLLKRDVDLLNLRKVSTVFQIQIIDKGKLIFCADRYAKEEFEMLATSFYIKLNEERKGILEDILKSPSR